ncbi:MAG: hypothetical protein KGD64_02950 [Candidatus Heimdallarchaeota archaeon]|nr:hypothetical protein [Candidatus Heimdallarchaeota archaeon]
MNESNNKPRSKMMSIMRESPFFRFLFIQLVVVLFIMLLSIVLMLLPVDPSLFNQIYTESIIFLLIGAFTALIGLFIYMIPLFIRILQIRKTDTRIEFKEEQINNLMIPGLIVFILGFIINIVGVTRYFL